MLACAGTGFDPIRKTPLAMCTIKTRDDVILYVKDHGTGRPVVLLHGWPLSADTFDDLALAITKAGMRAISYDRRGFGRLPKCPMSA